MKTFTATISLIAAFCVGALCYQVVVPDAKADSSHNKRRWQYQCFEAGGVAQITMRANKMGADGWELVTSAGGKKETVWCFKRPSVKLVRP